MKVAKVEDHVYKIFCPGCSDWHTIHVNGKANASGSSWSFDMNMDAPTFSPSISLRTGIYADPKWTAPSQSHNWSVICHFFIKAGKIIYTGDCTHELKGKVIDLPEL